jgi:hypothetical protein
VRSPSASSVLGTPRPALEPVGRARSPSARIKENFGIKEFLRISCGAVCCPLEHPADDGRQGARMARRTLDLVLPVVKYMLARLVLFVLAVTVLGLLGAGRELALVVGLLISALLSYVLLGRLRDASSAVIIERVRARRERRRAARVDEDALYEDALVDAQTDGPAHEVPEERAGRPGP